MDLREAVLETAKEMHWVTFGLDKTAWKAFADKLAEVMTR